MTHIDVYNSFSLIHPFQWKLWLQQGFRLNQSSEFFIDPTTDNYRAMWLAGSVKFYGLIFLIYDLIKTTVMMILWKMYWCWRWKSKYIFLGVYKIQGHVNSISANPGENCYMEDFFLQWPFLPLSSPPTSAESHSPKPRVGSLPWPTTCHCRTHSCFTLLAFTVIFWNSSPCLY